jgi:hypothetical protein
MSGGRRDQRVKGFGSYSGSRGGENDITDSRGPELTRGCGDKASNSSGD